MHRESLLETQTYQFKSVTLVAAHSSVNFHGIFFFFQINWSFILKANAAAADAQLSLECVSGFSAKKFSALNAFRNDVHSFLFTVNLQQCSRFTLIKHTLNANKMHRHHSMQKHDAQKPAKHCRNCNARREYLVNFSKELHMT